MNINAKANELEASAEDEVRIATGAEGAIDAIDTLYGADQPGAGTSSGQTMLAQANRAQVALTNASAFRRDADVLVRSAVAFMPPEVYAGQLAQFQSQRASAGGQLRF